MVKMSASKLSGLQKASVIMMSLEEDIAAKVFSMMSEDEIKAISSSMSSLGTIDTKSTENLITEFSDKLSTGSGIVGNASNTQKILSKALGEEGAAAMMETLGGPEGRDTWDKLNNVNEEVLASFIKNEYPQTAALVLSKIRSTQAAKVLTVLPDDFAMDVIQRMLTIEPVKNEILTDIEKTLNTEFMSSLATTQQVDSYELMAEVFNNLDRNTETKFFEMLEKTDDDSATRIRELMFTFEDLINIDASGIQTLISKADKDFLVIALKGANDEMRELFFSNMSERAAKIMKEDMESKGPVRMRDVDEAQLSIVNTAKELAESGDIVIPEDEVTEEMVY